VSLDNYLLLFYSNEQIMRGVVVFFSFDHRFKTTDFFKFIPPVIYYGTSKPAPLYQDSYLSDSAFNQHAGVFAILGAGGRRAVQTTHTCDATTTTKRVEKTENTVIKYSNNKTCRQNAIRP